MKKIHRSLIFILGLFLIVQKGYSQLESIEDYSIVNSKPVNWKKTVLHFRPDSVLHFYDSDLLFNKDNDGDSKYSGKIRSYFDDGKGIRREDLEQIYHYKHVYKTDSALNILGNLVQYDSCQKIENMRCPAVYRDFLIVYKKGTIIQFIAICTSCLSVLSMPNQHSINCLVNSFHFIMYISHYGRGYNLFDDRIRRY